MLVGVLLAAGASTRMGRDKALVKSKGASFAVKGVRHLWVACDCAIVVVGAHAPKVQRALTDEFEALVASGGLHDELQQAHRHGAAGLECQFAVNARWKQGMLSSAQVGLAAALKLKPQGILVMPVDHPHVHPVTVAALGNVLLQAVAANRTAKHRAGFSYALVPRYKGHRGHPLALTPALAKAIVADRKAEHLSDAVRRSARLVGYLDVHDKGVIANVNTPAARRRKTT
jgi:CTP:molybdopterin cytidylyltransferase MocA